MGFDEIKNILIEAVKNVVMEDAYLLLHDINELAITHRLAMYLTPQFKGFDVDCEYNGNIDANNGRKYIKLLNYRYRELGLVRVKDSDEESIDRRVYPDIIVHKRGKNGEENNLLIIEVKKSSNPINGEWDAEKLSRFTSKEDENNFGYCFGAFVRFEVGHHIGFKEVEWYKDGKKYNDYKVSNTT